MLCARMMIQRSCMHEHSNHHVRRCAVHSTGVPFIYHGRNIHAWAVLEFA